MQTSPRNTENTQPLCNTRHGASLTSEGHKAALDLVGGTRAHDRIEFKSMQEKQEKTYISYYNFY